MANVHVYYQSSLSCVVKNNDKKKLDFLSKNCISTTSQLVTYISVTYFNIYFERFWNNKRLLNAIDLKTVYIWIVSEV